MRNAELGEKANLLSIIYRQRRQGLAAKPLRVDLVSGVHTLSQCIRISSNSFTYGPTSTGHGVHLSRMQYRTVRSRACPLQPLIMH